MIELRPIVEDERAELWEAVQRCWKELMPHAPVAQDPERGAVYFASHFKFDAANSVHWWAIIGDAKIGFAKVDLHKDDEGLWGQVRDFFIEPVWRRQGHGRAFAQAIVDWLKGRGAYRIDLNVRHDNPNALAFWRNVGLQLALYHLRMYFD